MLIVQLGNINWRLLVQILQSAAPRKHRGETKMIVKGVELLIARLTQLHHAPKEVPRTPCAHNQQHSEVECSYSCPVHQLQLLLQEGSEHISPEKQ